VDRDRLPDGVANAILSAFGACEVPLAREANDGRLSFVALSVRSRSVISLSRSSFSVSISRRTSGPGAGSVGGDGGGATLAG
jgi:hypothetical protein